MVNTFERWIGSLNYTAGLLAALEPISGLRGTSRETLRTPQVTNLTGNTIDGFFEVKGGICPWSADEISIALRTSPNECRPRRPGRKQRQTCGVDLLPL